MIKTIAATTTRMDAVKNQYAYALKIISHMKMDRVTLFLKEIEAKNICEISFHGVKPGTNVSEEDIFFRVDWDKHDMLNKEGYYYINEDGFEDGVAPEPSIECYLFNERLKQKGLSLRWFVDYANHIKSNSSARTALNSKLGLVTTKPGDEIIFSKGSSLKYEKNIHNVSEMSIGVSSD